MALNTKDFSSLVQETVANIQGFAAALVDLTIGSILLAAVEAFSSVVMWLQAMILALLATTRAATSSGADLDSFVNDFGVTRLPATFASGLATFSRFTPTAQAVIPVGAIIQTGDGTQQFSVDLDTSHPAYSASLAGYVIQAGTASLDVTVTALTAGIGANVVAGAISAIAQAIPGVDTVTNGAAYTNGANAESDPALRVRFVAYIQSLSKATKAAIAFAITSLEQGLSYTLTENQDRDGTYRPGYFFVVVDDGTGAPPSSLITTVYNAIDAVRGFTITFDVFAPTVVNASVIMAIATGDDYVHADVTALVVTALQTYINTLSLGTSLAYSRLAQVAYDASPGVTNVTGVTLNGGTGDVAANSQQVVKANSVVVN